MILGLFAFIGIVIPGVSIWMTIGRIKFGQVCLWLDDPVLRRGGGLDAKVAVSSRLAPAKFVTATLSYILCRMKSGHGLPTYDELPLWNVPCDFRCAAVGVGRRRTTPDVVLDIPADKPATDLPGASMHGSVGVVGFPSDISSDHSYYV